MIEVSEAATMVQEKAGEAATIIFGAVYDETVPDFCSITIIATGLENGRFGGIATPPFISGNYSTNKTAGGLSFMPPYGTTNKPVTPAPSAATIPTPQTRPMGQAPVSNTTATQFGGSAPAPAPKPQSNFGSADGGIQIPPFLQKNKKKD